MATNDIMNRPGEEEAKHPFRWPLLAAVENRSRDQTKDGKIINAYMEKLDQGDWCIIKRPGLSAYSQPSGGSATGRGIVHWRGNIYSIFGTTLYKDGVSKGTVNGTNGVYKFTSTLGGTPKLFLMNGVKAYTYDDTNGLVEVTDADYPTSLVKGCVYLDGTVYVMDSTAQIFGSALNDTQTWTATNLIVAQIEPDGGIALHKQLNYVVAFKQWSTEIFYDAANATGSPLSPVQAAKVNFGCASAESVQEIDGALYWITINKSGSAGAMKLDQVKPTIISTKAVERLLENIDWSSGVYSFQFKSAGHRFYGITSTTTNITLIYDTMENLWSEWTDTAGNYFPIVGSTWNSVSSTFELLQHESNGRIYKADISFTTDNGDSIPVDIITPIFDAGTRFKKMLSVLEIVSDVTPGILLFIRNSDDDYRTWKNYRTVDLGKLHPKLINCGTFSRRAYHLRHVGETQFRLYALEYQLGLGTL